MGASMDEALAVYRIADDLHDGDQALGVMRIDPVWAKDIPATRYFELVRHAMSVGDRVMTPAEVGCALAHVAVLERIATSGRHGLVLEQDQPVTAAELLRVRRLMAERPDLDFLHLQGDTFRPMRGRLRKDGFYEVDCAWDFSGTAAYVVSPRSAASIASFQRRSLVRADDWSRFVAECGIEPLYLPLFGKLIAGSTIETERAALGTIRFFPFLLRRATGRMRLYRRRMRKALRLVPRTIPQTGV